MRHIHRPTERHITGTPECIVVRKGKTEVIIFDNDKNEVCRRTLNAGDILLLVSGGHGFTYSEDTVLMEIKQGPFVGVDDKERF